MNLALPREQAVAQLKVHHPLLRDCGFSGVWGQKADPSPTFALFLCVAGRSAAAGAPRRLRATDQHPDGKLV
jgi:hypothetical protein